MNSHVFRRVELRSRRAVILTAIIFAAAGLGPIAGTTRIELRFDPPTITQREDGSVFVVAPDCVTFNEPGLPLLPARPAVVLLPPGETVTAIRVQPGRERGIAGAYRVAPAQEQQPLSVAGPFRRTEPNNEVYGRDTLYPSVAARLVVEQRGWGHGLAFLRVFPAAYRPLSGELLWYESVVVEVDSALAPGADGQVIPRLRRTRPVLERLAGMVVNPQDLVLYDKAQPAAGPPSGLKPDYYPYVIITKAKLEDAFRPVADFQSSRGLRARIVTVEEISGGYTEGRDIPERIRLFIIDAYEKWGTEYVLLGGDETVLKVRNLYVTAGTETVYTDSFPGDCYFEGLDGTWNDDDDSLWGEPGEEDLVGEIAVGRASIDSATELGNWFHKTEMYSEHPVVSQIEKALFIGEWLGADDWGGDSMDDIRDGSDACGYATAGYPAGYDTQTLYERDAPWDKYDLIALMNEGFPTTHHLGHAAWFIVMKMEVGDVAALTNDGVSGSYMFNYSQGCIAGGFDVLQSDCIAEAFVNDEHGSAAFVANSRYGWYEPGTVCGSSQHYERQFVDARYGEEITTAGRMNVDSKTDLVWMLDPFMRWCHYELNLLGDPALPQWNSVLGGLALQHAGEYVIGQGGYRVTVTVDGAPVPGATVTLYTTDFAIWASDLTNESGVAQLNPGDVDSTTLLLKAVKADYLPATDTVQVTVE